MYQELLTEKYRPKNLDEVALPKRIKDFLEGGIKTNLMFYGTQGSGKTSTAKLMVKQNMNIMRKLSKRLSGHLRNSTRR